jgi:chromate transport protein ChrA
MVGAIFYLLKDICLLPIIDHNADGWLSAAICLSTFLVLHKTKIPAPFIVLACLVVGWLL